MAGFMASKFVAECAFSFAAGASLCAFYENYKLEQNNFRTIAMDIIDKKEKEMCSDEFEALKQDIITWKIERKLEQLKLENRIKVETLRFLQTAISSHLV